MGAANESSHSWTRLRLKAPLDSPGWLEHPAISDYADLLSHNDAIWGQSSPFPQNESLDGYRHRARQEFVSAAALYARGLWGEISLPDNAIARPWIATGHQPILAHPGVWGKNFVTHWLSRQVGGVGINLIVDNDLLSSTQIMFPARDGNRLVMQAESFAAELQRTPWEDVTIPETGPDAEIFASFGDRAIQRMRQWNIIPAIENYWPSVLIRFEQSRNISDLFSAARHDFEQKWGVNLLELPISHMCRMETFLEFICFIIENAVAFAEVHNRTLHEYRRLYRIRSRSHPVPELEILPDRCEVPFWIWKAGNRERKRLFVQHRAEQIILTDGRDVVCRLSDVGSNSSRLKQSIEQLRNLESTGIRLRTRALTTTLFARIALADLFVHGIGGSQYDQITDRIIHRFLGLTAPRFFTVTATLHLPLDRHLKNENRISPHASSKLAHQLRDLRYNPDRHLGTPSDASSSALIDEKQQLCREQLDFESHQTPTTHIPHSPESSRRRYQRFREINELLQPFVAERKQELEFQSRELIRRMHDQHVLFHREYPVWLYPEEMLQQFYSRWISSSG